MPFQPGQSGNPAGRPRGARNRITMLVEELLAGNADALVRKLIDQAMAGNPAAMALLARSLLPQRKGATVRIDLPELEQASDAPTAISAIYAAVCAGELAPADGNSLIRMVEAFLRVKQKTGEAESRPERHRAADAAVAQMNHAPQPAAAPECQSPASVPLVHPVATAATEPDLDARVAEALRGFFEEGSGGRLIRGETPASGAPGLARQAAVPRAIVSHCNSGAAPDASGRNGRAAA
jgi:hypothetical protein